MNDNATVDYGQLSDLQDAVRAYANVRHTLPTVQPLEARCASWWRHWSAAIATVERCRREGLRNYELETLGYLHWLLVRRPMKGTARDFWGNA